MPTLDWIGKDAVVKHHKDVPYRLLEPVAGLSCGDTKSDNLAVEYKGANQRAAIEDDRLIGGLWEELSDGRCRFVMTTEKDWSRIDAKL